MRRAGLLCATLMVLTACGGGTPDPGPDAASTSAADTTTASTTSGPDVVVVVDPCDLLTPDEVATATGLEVTEVLAGPPITCVFDLGPEAGVDVFIALDDGQGRLGGAEAVFAAYATLLEGGEAEAVGELGEAALYAPGFRGLAVDAGAGKFIALGVNGTYQQLADPRAALVELAAIAVSRL
jgi:hypothetical protein